MRKSTLLLVCLTAALLIAAYPLPGAWAAFARATGIPLRTLEDWDAQRYAPTNVYQLLKAARVLGCHIEDIIEETE